MNLEYLDLNENDISEIEGLDTLVNLKHLDLGCNNGITEIVGLDKLVNLEYLIIC